MGRGLAFGLVVRTAHLALALISATPAFANREPSCSKPARRWSCIAWTISGAIATLRQAIAADPQDAGAYRGLAGALWMSVTFARGTLTVDSYLGEGLARAIKLPAPPPETAAAFTVMPSIGRSRWRARGLRLMPATPTLSISSARRLGFGPRAPRPSMAASAKRLALPEACDSTKALLRLDPRRHDAGVDRRHIPIRGRCAGAADAVGSRTWPASAADAKRAAG